MNDSLLGDAKSFLNSLSTNKRLLVGEAEWFRYRLIKDVGLSTSDFLSTPLPVLFSLMRCLADEKEQERRALEKSRKKQGL